MKRIIVITDCYDLAFNEIRAEMLNVLGENAKEVDIEPVVKVKEYSLINCAFITRLMAENYSGNTTFMVLCSPLKEKPNRIYGITFKNNIKFYGVNNGVLSWLLSDLGVKELYVEENKPDDKYTMFSGKYDYASATAKISLADNLKKLTIGRMGSDKDVKKLIIDKGTIVHIDNFGLCKIKGTLPSLKVGDRVTLKIKGKRVDATFCKRLMSLPDGTLGFYRGSSFGLPEVGIARGNAAERFKLAIGDKILW